MAWILRSTLLDFRHGLSAFLVVRSAAVPLILPLHEGDALAFGGVCDHHRRPRSAALPGLFDRIDNAGDLMAVALEDLPSEGFPLVGQRFQIERVRDRSAKLNPVVIDDGRSGRSTRRRPANMAASQTWPS